MTLETEVNNLSLRSTYLETSEGNLGRGSSGALRNTSKMFDPRSVPRSRSTMIYGRGFQFFPAQRQVYGVKFIWYSTFYKARKPSVLQE